MSFRTDLLPTLDSLRALTGPATFDVRTSTVTIRTRTWTGTTVRDATRAGSYSDSTLELTPRPKVQQVGNGSLLVGPITPAHASGGYTPEQLNPTPTDSTEVTVIVDGPNGSHEYVIVGIDTSKPFRYMLQLAANDRAVPY